MTFAMRLIRETLIAILGGGIATYRAQLPPSAFAPNSTVCDLPTASLRSELFAFAIQCLLFNWGMGMQTRRQSAHHFARMFARYIGVGGAAFLIDLSVFLLLVRGFGLSAQASQAISRTVGAIAGLGGHRYFSFAQRHQAGTVRHLSGIETFSYGILTVFGITFSPFVLQFIISHITNTLVLAKIFNECIMVCINFIAMRAIFLKKT
ncbi:GtrA family protein [Paraburkholderia ferrariae]|uniref:GtrA family protein n=1 Tax=Paraburkholderia ferrariae TaxID=386056 RepID=A0ABU9RSC1_9BURK